MLSKNNMIIGFVVGLIFPVFTWLMADVVLKSYTATLDKPVVPYLIGIAVNLYIIRYFFKKGFDLSGTGAILCTFIYMAIVFLFKMGHLA
jgi:hypothetical protein